MKKKRVWLACAAMAAVLIYTMTPFAAEARRIGPGMYAVQKELAREVLSDMSAEEQAVVNRLVLVESDGTDYGVLVGYYTRASMDETEDPWQMEFVTPGVCGQKGIAEEKREGDWKTPAGTYSFSSAFGIKEDPGSRISYRQVKDSDYWVDDGDSRYYNQLVDGDRVEKDWESAEHLISKAPWYNYALVLNYNEDCVPGMGSAIFLHCWESPEDPGTHGCVGIPEELMMRLVQEVDENTRIVLVSDND